MAAASHYRWILAGALLLYCLWAGLLILENPGLQYDEALLVLGAVYMRHPQANLNFGQDPASWICHGERCFSLMTVPYAGSVKEYLCLPVFAMFGAGAHAVRIVSALLGLLGILGIARLISKVASPPAGAASACILAMHPAFLDLTVFDNGTVAVWMGALGLLCLAAAAYLTHPSARGALWLGLAAGLGVWARANFLWMLASAVAAAIIVLRGRIGVPFSHWRNAFAGALLGCAPMIAYEIRSKGETWRALKTFAAHQPLRRLIGPRLVMLAETLLSDREHRAIWAGPAMTPWQRWICLGIALAACALCLSGKRSLWARGAALCFLFLATILVFSRLLVAEHHLIVLVPVAAVVVSLAAATLAETGQGRRVVIACAALYFGLAVYWQIATIRGLWSTGGVGQWSDAIFDLSEYLQSHYPQREIKILDWGLDDNLYVLSDGRIRAREIYGGASAERSQANRPWIDEIRAGGVFLVNGPQSRQFPEASVGFLEAVSSAQPPVRRFTVTQRNDVPYAEILDIEPSKSARLEAIPDDASIGPEIVSGDPKYAKQLEGFYGIEQGWRWTEREFSVILRAPEGSETAGARLTMKLTVPALSIEKLGGITLTAWIGEQVIGSQKYAAPGNYTFEKRLEPNWLKRGLNRIEFTLDKAIPPSSADGRELGVILVSARLEP